MIIKMNTVTPTLTSGTQPGSAKYRCLRAHSTMSGEGDSSHIVIDCKVNVSQKRCVSLFRFPFFFSPLSRPTPTPPTPH